MNIIQSMTGVFDAIGEWFSGAIDTLTAMFYNSTDGLTFLGTLAVVGLAFSIVFLLINVISNFLHLRG